MESVSDKISAHLNQFHASTLLLIAWHFTRRRDTVLAQMIQVDRLGFELRCHAHGGRYSEERVNFTAGPVDNGNVDTLFEVPSFKLSPSHFVGFGHNQTPTFFGLGIQQR